MKARKYVHLILLAMALTLLNGCDSTLDYFGLKEPRYYGINVTINGEQYGHTWVLSLFRQTGAYVAECDCYDNQYRISYFSTNYNDTDESLIYQIDFVLFKSAPFQVGDVFTFYTDSIDWNTYYSRKIPGFRVVKCTDQMQNKVVLEKSCAEITITEIKKDCISFAFNFKGVMSEDNRETDCEGIDGKITAYLFFVNKAAEGAVKYL